MHQESNNDGGRHPHDASRPQSGSAIDDAPIEPIKRPFTRATGFVYQSVGFMLTISTCCVWPAAYWWQGALSTESTWVVQGVVFSGETPIATAELWGMLGIVASFCGGMLLLVIGLGLQHDRMRTGRAALAVTGLVAAFFLAYLGMCIWSFPAAMRIVIVATMAVIWIVLFLLAGVSADELRKHPPTPSERGWTSIDEDDLRTISSHRSRDRKNP
ncbi:MAG: hypothetical protein H6818_21905 [Phycisphaerales bacterium]|nr:hypothetical protein [Phycisphaerales bacterium]MCB9862446.1 hypothetical protein [Phycisphaerales bacterium]